MKEVPKDKASGLSKAYVAGLSSATAKARAAHFKKADKLSDRDPRAYKPAPGDATAKTKPSKATLAVRKMMKEGDADNSLSAKAKKTGISLSTLKTVYKRGVAAWNSGHRPGTTPAQWGHARVNAYIRKGKGTYHGADKDLREAKEKQEYDYEGDMAMSQLKSIIANAQRMHDMLKVDTNLPEWVQSKITLAEDYITTASNYLQGEMKEEWEVRRGTQVISTHKKKDDADVKAMKHPLNKVYAKEDVDAYADALIRRNKQNLNKGHVVNAARIAGMDDKKLMAAVNKKVGRIKEEVAHSVHVKTYDSQGEKQMNSPEFKNHVSAHGGKLDYASDKGAAFKFASQSHAAAFHRGVQSKFRELDSEHDMHEEVAVNSVGAGNVAGLQGEPPVRKKKKNVMSFNRFAKK